MPNALDIISRPWPLRLLIGIILLGIYSLSTEALYRSLWIGDTEEIGEIERVCIYAIGKPLVGTETLIVAAGKYVPDDKVFVVTDDPIGKRAEVEEFFMRRRDLVFRDLKSINQDPPRDRCLWLYSPESACEVFTFGPKMTFLSKPGVSNYFPTAKYFEVNTKTITKCVKALFSK